MTGLELIKSKMLERGATNTQIQSKTFEMTIAVLAEVKESEKSLDLVGMYTEILDRYDRAKCNAEYRESLYQGKIKGLEESEKLIETKKRQVVEAITDLQNIINELLKINEDMTEPETPVQRDRMRTARFLMENTKVNTCYDNTAFIRALGNILSGTKEPDEPKQDYREQKKAKAVQNDKSEPSIKERLIGIKEALERNIYNGNLCKRY